MPTYDNVDVEHPRIAAAAKKMIREGKSTEEVAKVIGMPWEVIRKFERDVKREDR